MDQTCGSISYLSLISISYRLSLTQIDSPVYQTLIKLPGQKFQQLFQYVTFLSRAYYDYILFYYFPMLKIQFKGHNRERETNNKKCLVLIHSWRKGRSYKRRVCVRLKDQHRDWRFSPTTASILEKGVPFKNNWTRSIRLEWSSDLFINGTKSCKSQSASSVR